MINEVWYLLYGGHSVDGMGPGKYVGRTTHEEVALSHHKAMISDPYSTGYVMRVTETEASRWRPALNE
jgi:hypothetical protein